MVDVPVVQFPISCNFFSLQKSSVASNRVLETFGVSCERSFPELQLLSRLGSRRGVHRSLSQHSHLPVVPPVLFQLWFPFSFWSHCGDPPDCCSQFLAVSFDCCDRFLAQGNRVYHLVRKYYHVAPHVLLGMYVHDV